jgi:K+-sensing histidine kinase KdpD
MSSTAAKPLEESISTPGLTLTPSELTRMAVHDLRNAAASIVGNVEFVRTRLPEGEAHAAAVDAVIGAHELLRGLANLADLEAASQGNSCARENLFSTIDVFERVRRTSEQMLSRFGHTLVLDLSSDVPLARGNAEVLERVLESLLFELVRRSTEPVTMVASMRATGDHAIELRIAQGVTREVAIPVELGPPHNLGLLFCKVAVAQHGGTLQVEGGGKPRAFRIIWPTHGR